MKIILIFIVIALIGFVLYNRITDNKESKRTGNDKIDIQGEIEWDEMERLILNFNTDFNNGKKNIKKEIIKNYPNFSTGFIDEINLNETKKEFLIYIREVVKKHPINSKIKSLNIGIFETDTNFLCYLSGSKITHKENPDNWAVDPKYFPKVYCDLKDFKLIYKELKKYKGNISDIEQIFINGFMNLIISNSIEEIEKLTGSKKMNIGSGFDSGDIFIIKEY